MIEAKPLPELALTAVKLANDRHNVLINNIAQETLDAMGLRATDGWKIALDVGQAMREVADAPPPPPPTTKRPARQSRRRSRR